MTSYAHSLPGTPKTCWEPLRDHLDKVAESAAAFADEFGARCWGEILGRCHDLGKLSKEFQLYLSQAEPDAADAGAEEDTPGKRVDHSTFGSRFVYQAMGNGPGEILAFCIAGHHTGLPDETSADDGGQRCTLRYKLDATKYRIPDVIAWADLKLPKPLKSPLKPSQGDEAFQIAFFTRMLFSCLIDADRTRTEEFCAPEIARERSGLGGNSERPTLAEIKAQLYRSLLEMKERADRTEVNRQRAIVLDHCRQAASWPPGFFSLNVPTGGGKTLSSLAFALEHALKTGHELRRVVMAIPYTSIIEQTADAYRKVLGELAERALVEHHTNLQPKHDTRGGWPSLSSFLVLGALPLSRFLRKGGDFDFLTCMRMVEDLEDCPADAFRALHRELHARPRGGGQARKGKLGGEFWQIDGTPGVGDTRFRTDEGGWPALVCAATPAGESHLRWPLSRVKVFARGLGLG